MNKVKQTIADFENENGTKITDINTKQLVLILHKELSEKIDRYIEDTKPVFKQLANHDKLFQEITDRLPELGFCQKVTNALWPEPPEIPLNQKVDTMWHDRRWIKGWLKYIFAAILLVGGGNIAIQMWW